MTTADDMIMAASALPVDTCAQLRQILDVPGDDPHASPTPQGGAATSDAASPVCRCEEYRARHEAMLRMAEIQTASLQLLADNVRAVVSAINSDVWASPRQVARTLMASVESAENNMAQPPSVRRVARLESALEECIIALHGAQQGDTDVQWALDLAHEAMTEGVL
jgi:hypothetical protein